MSESKDIPYQKMNEKQDKQLTLTMPEILFIDDNITLMIDARDVESMMPLKPSMPSSIIIVTIDFIDRIGKAFLDVSSKSERGNTKATSTINVSELDLYMLREMCFSRIDYFGHRVGLSLKKKVLYSLYGNTIKQEDILENLLKDVDLGDTKWHRKEQ